MRKRKSARKKEIKNKGGEEKQKTKQRKQKD